MDWNAAVPVQIVEPIDRWWPLVICWDWLLWRVTSFPWSPPGRMVGRHCPTGNAWAVTRAASQRARPVYRTDFSSNSFHSYPIWTCPDFLSRRIPSVGSFYDFFQIRIFSGIRRDSSMGSSAFIAVFYLEFSISIWSVRVLFVN